jgi:hypothetical protein
MPARISRCSAVASRSRTKASSIAFANPDASMIASVAPSGDPASIWSARRLAPARCLHECSVAKQFLMDGDLMIHGSSQKKWDG